MYCDSFVFPCGAEPEMYLPAKRYRLEGINADDGMTLIVAHGTGAHKEQWEPALERLFQLQSGKIPRERIREAWSFDSMSHGHGGVLNAAQLKGKLGGVTVAEWGAAIAVFLESEYVRGHRLVALGHSAGTAALVLSTALYPANHIPYSALLLVETPITSRVEYHHHFEARERALGAVTTMTRGRRDTWSGREAAFEWFKARRPWSGWDERVLRTFTDHGLRPVTADEIDGPVTLKCDKAQEAAGYADTAGYFDALDRLVELCPYVPVHLIFGEKNDLVLRETQDAVYNACRGLFASCVRVKGCGHLIVQENPDAVAMALSEALSCTPPSRCKL